MPEETKSSIRICGLFATDHDDKMRNGIFLSDGLFDDRLKDFLLTKTLNGVLILDRPTWEDFRKTIDLTTLSWQHHIVVCGGEPFEIPSELNAMVVHVAEEGFEIVLSCVISGLSRSVFVSGAKKFMQTCERLFDEFYQIKFFQFLTDPSEELIYFPDRCSAETIRLEDVSGGERGQKMPEYTFSHYDLSEAFLPPEREINLTGEQGELINALATAFRRAAGEHMIKHADKLNLATA